MRNRNCNRCWQENVEEHVYISSCNLTFFFLLQNDYYLVYVPRLLRLAYSSIYAIASKQNIQQSTYSQFIRQAGDEEREAKKTSRKNPLCYKPCSQHQYSVPAPVAKNWKKNEIVYCFWFVGLGDSFICSFSASLLRVFNYSCLKYLFDCMASTDNSILFHTICL